MEKMRTSEKGRNLIKKFEGLRLQPYKCSAGVPTIGYGSTFYPDGRLVTLKDSFITQTQAEELLSLTLIKFEKGVEKLITAPISQSMFDSLVCFAFNIGLGNLQASTLRKLVNLEQYEDISRQFLRWNKAAGVPLAGLTRRREAEAKLFAEGVLELHQSKKENTVLFVFTKQLFKVGN